MTHYRTALSLLVVCLVSAAAQQQPTRAPSPALTRAPTQHRDGAKAAPLPELKPESKGTLGILDALEDPRNGAQPGEPTS